MDSMPRDPAAAAVWANSLDSRVASDAFTQVAAVISSATGANLLPECTASAAAVLAVLCKDTNASAVLLGIAEEGSIEPTFLSSLSSVIKLCGYEASGPVAACSSAAHSTLTSSLEPDSIRLISFLYVVKALNNAVIPHAAAREQVFVLKIVEPLCQVMAQHASGVYAALLGDAITTTARFLQRLLSLFSPGRFLFRESTSAFQQFSKTVQYASNALLVVGDISSGSYDSSLFAHCCQTCIALCKALFASLASEAVTTDDASRSDENLGACLISMLRAVTAASSPASGDPTAGDELVQQVVSLLFAGPEMWSLIVFDASDASSASSCVWVLYKELVAAACAHDARGASGTDPRLVAAVTVAHRIAIARVAARSVLLGIFTTRRDDVADDGATAGAGSNLSTSPAKECASRKSSAPKHVVALLQSHDDHVRALAGELLWTACSEDAAQVLQAVGIGLAAGLLHKKGALALPGGEE